MDRAMVYTQVEEQSVNLAKLEWFDNIPFSAAPKELITSLGLDYNDYLKRCPFMDELPTYWNLALVYDGKIVLFTWGTFDFLENLVHVVRIAINPSLYSINNNLLRMVVEKYREISQGGKVYFISDRWRAFLRKLPRDLKLSEARVLEVRDV